MMSVRTKFNSLLGFIAAEILLIFGKSSDRHTHKDLRNMEFKTSTQRIGVTFTEKIRDTFRFKWLRKI